MLTYFQATAHINPEGDVLISDDTIQGLGIAQKFLQSFFGSIFLIARTPPQSSSSNDHIELSEMASPADVSHSAISQSLPPRYDVDDLDAPIVEVQKGLYISFVSVLIACVPNPGYFVAGGVAGIVSRTSTAPLDRLKVYLIAQTSVAQEAVTAAKSGNVFQAALNAWRPLAGATKELWQAGGMRSLYAGKCQQNFLQVARLIYSGNGLNVVKVMPESAIKFGSYEASIRSSRV